MPKKKKRKEKPHSKPNSYQPAPLSGQIDVTVTLDLSRSLEREERIQNSNEDVLGGFKKKQLFKFGQELFSHDYCGEMLVTQAADSMYWS